jgi:hypothetical protein
VSDEAAGEAGFDFLQAKRKTKQMMAEITSARFMTALLYEQITLRSKSIFAEIKSANPRTRAFVHSNNFPFVFCVSSLAWLD